MGNPATDNTCESCLYGAEVPDSIEFYDTVMWDCSHPVPKGYNGYRHYLRAADSKGCACWRGYVPTTHELVCRADELEKVIPIIESMQKKGV